MNEVGVVAQRDVEEEHERAISASVGAERLLEEAGQQQRRRATAAISARLSAPRHVGGWSSRSLRARGSPLPSACARRRSACGRCARAPRPSRRRCRGAWSGACFFVWAMVIRTLARREGVFDRCARLRTGDRRRGKPVERRRGRQADELGARARARGARPPRRRRRSGIAAGGPRRWSRPARRRARVELQAERAHARQALRAALADARGDRARVARASRAARARR